MPPPSGFPPGFMDMFPTHAKPAPLDGDIPYIRCSVCDELALQLHAAAGRMVKELGPKRQPKRRLETSSNLGGLEEQVETMLTEICNVEKTAGKWLRNYDISKAGSALSLVKRKPGKCRRECRTVEKACNAVLEAQKGDDDLSEVLLQQRQTRIQSCQMVSTCLFATSHLPPRASPLCLCSLSR